MKKLKIVFWAASIIVLLLLIGFFYSAFLRPQYGTSNTNIIALVAFGILMGGVIVFLLLKLLQKSEKTHSKTHISSHTVVESMKKVFKIVVAEGQLNEIYNYENTKKLLKFIPSTKKALVIVRAKVLIGYDIEKCKWEVDEESKIIRLIDFPKPEILSLDSEFNYYYFEDDLFNFINRKDLQDIQDLAKEQVKNVALQSNLMKIASEQMKTLLSEVLGANMWKIENLSKVDDYKFIPKTTETKEKENGDEKSLLKSDSLKNLLVKLLGKQLDYH